MRYVLILSVLVFASTAFGTVYSWVDYGGVRHFANRMYDVPERYRIKVNALYPEPSDVRTPSPPAPEQQRPVVAVVAPQPVSPTPQPVAVQRPVASDEGANTARSAPVKRRERRVKHENDE